MTSTAQARFDAYARTAFTFQMSSLVAQRFNAYAAAAAPREIGGLLRVQRQQDGSFLACDLKIFPQHASAASFELDSTAVAAHNMELVRDGRGEEAREWCALIHSHPGYTAMPSGPDVDAIHDLAGDGFAFSVICVTSTTGRPDGNRYRVVYGQNLPLPLTVADITVASADGQTLRGIAALTEHDLDTIQAHVAELLNVTHPDGFLRDLQSARGSRAQSSFGATPLPGFAPWVPEEFHAAIIGAFGQASVTTAYAPDRIAEELRDSWPPSSARRRRYREVLEARRDDLRMTESEDTADAVTALTGAIEAVSRWFNAPSRSRRPSQPPSSRRAELDEGVAQLLREQLDAYGTQVFGEQPDHNLRVERLRSAIRFNSWLSYQSAITDAISLLMFSRKQLAADREGNAEQLESIKGGLTALSGFAS